jgi:alpha-tubulin suppressor-like RCC1 family protein
MLALGCADSTGPGAPSKLTFITQPKNAVAGTKFSPVAVAIQDDGGRTVTSATNSVTIAIESNPRNGTLSGALTVAAVNGVATFANLTIDVATTGYTLSANSPDLTNAVSTSFAITTGPAAKLGFSSQPVTTIANTAIPAFSVQVQDAAGNVIFGATNPIRIEIGNNPGAGTLLGPSNITAANGVAIFYGLSINRLGTGYFFIASTPNLASATSSPFDMIVGPPNRLAFTVQPRTTPPGTAISPAVAVTVQDIGGNTVTAGNVSITMSIGANAGGGTLSGTTTVAAVNGVATFTDLSIDNSGERYQLQAAASDLTSVTSVAFSVRNPPVFAMISAGYFHSCGVTTTNVAYCWGWNDNGRLGDGGTSESHSPVAVTSGGVSFAGISAGRDHTCAVSTPGGSAFCWGQNGNGRLGDGGSDTRVVPQAVSGGRSYGAVNAGYLHTCGVTSSGDGYCWGDNSEGEIGNNTQVMSRVPVAVTGGRTWATITPGRYFSCGLTTTGEAYCWGTNSDGELGDGTKTRRTSPVAVSGQLTFVLVSAGGFYSCGIVTGGAAYCWGNNDLGQLGNGTTTQSSVPVAVSGNLIFATLSAGNRHTCGVTTTGVGYCWGDNSSGNLGNSSTNANSSTPSPVSGNLSFSAISAGRFHTCGVTTTGAGYCWGDNSSGKLGDGTTEFRTAPVRVR